MTTSPSTALSIPELRSAVRGRLITPDDPDYDEARTVIAGGIDRQPAAIVRVANAADVRRVIALARETGLELAVRSGGHSGAGHSTTDGGIVIDLRDMKAIEIDPERRTAWAETGLTAGEVTTAAAEHGLAIGFGDTGSVGIGGITIGGGIGYLVRKHGLTIDNVLAAEVVTADGQLLHVDAETRSRPVLGDPRRRRQLRRRDALPVSGSSELPAFVGGMLVLPATAETVAGFIAAAEAAPEELSTIANVMNCPPMPFVPEEHHGKLVILGMLACAGDAGGRRARRSRRSARWHAARRHGQADALPGDVPAGRRTTYHPTAVGAPCSSTAVDGDEAETIMRLPRGIGRPDARRPAARARRRDGPRAGRRDGVRAPRQPDHGHRRRVLRGRGRPAVRAGVGAERFAAASAPGRRRAPTSTSSATRARPASTLRTRARPGTAWRRIKAPLRPDQPVPPQPERPASGTMTVMPEVATQQPTSSAGYSA